MISGTPGSSGAPAALIEKGFMLIAIVLFATFLLAPSVFVFKGSVEKPLGFASGRQTGPDFPQLHYDIE